MKTGSCRIIGGRWRGRKIKFDDAEGLRPTTDRIRETVFNWLQPYIHQSRCLDVFAGSGVLGFEALSRGASDIVFIEQNHQTVKNLKQNICMLDTDKASVVQQDALSWLASFTGDKPFDLVFLDPPFHSKLLAQSSVALSKSGCLAADAIIYVEHNIDTEFELPENWCVFKEKKAGQVAYKLFEHRVVTKT